MPRRIAICLYASNLGQSGLACYGSGSGSCKLELQAIWVSSIYLHQLKSGGNTDKMETFCSLWEQDKLDLHNYLNSIRKTEDIIAFHLDNFFIPQRVCFFHFYLFLVVFVLFCFFHLIRYPIGNIARIISLCINIQMKT